MKVKLDFPIKVPQVEANLGAWCNRITTKLGYDILARLQQSTPVDTGYARGRWVLTRPARPFGPAKITNDAAYILRLNDGWSKQQPAPAWIEACFAAGVAFLR